MFKTQEKAHTSFLWEKELWEARRWKRLETKMSEGGVWVQQKVWSEAGRAEGNEETQI